MRLRKQKKRGGAFPLAAIMAGAQGVHQVLKAVKPATLIENALARKNINVNNIPVLKQLFQGAKMIGYRRRRKMIGGRAGKSLAEIMQSGTRRRRRARMSGMRRAKPMSGMRRGRKMGMRRRRARRPGRKMSMARSYVHPMLSPGINQGIAYGERRRRRRAARMPAANRQMLGLLNRSMARAKRRPLRFANINGMARNKYMPYTFAMPRPRAHLSMFPASKIGGGVYSIKV